MSSYDTYNSWGNPAPKVGDIVRCEHPGFYLIGEAIYQVTSINCGTPGGLELNDREDGKEAPVKGVYGPWRFRLLRRN